MFGSLGFPELMLIFAVALIVFGPRKLPEIGRLIGKAMGEFKRATEDMKSTIEREVRMEELKELSSPISVPSHPIVSRGEPAIPEMSVPDAHPAAEPAQAATHSE